MKVVVFSCKEKQGFFPVIQDAVWASNHGLGVRTVLINLPL